MGDFKKSFNDKPRGGFGGDRGGSKFGGPKKFGSRPEGAGSFSRGKFGSGERAAAMMHPATCTECGNKCMVPFRPTGEKPIFCDNCFGDKREAPSRDFRSDSRDFRDAPRRDARPDSRSSFAPKPSNNDGAIKELNQQVSALHMKMDKILAAMGATPAQKFAAKAEKAADKATDFMADMFEDTKSTLKDAVKKAGSSNAMKEVKKDLVKAKKTGTETLVRATKVAKKTATTVAKAVNTVAKKVAKATEKPAKKVAKKGKK